MKQLLLLFRGGRRWQDDATAVVPRTTFVGLFLTAGVILWLASQLLARHQLLAGPVHTVLVLAFACLLVVLSGQAKGVQRDLRQLRSILAVFHLNSSAPWWQHAALRTGCIVLGVRRKDG